MTTRGARPLERCPACDTLWSPGRSLRVPLDGSEEAMLTPALSARLPDLAYSRCGRCRSVLAVDARRDAALLAAIYEELPLSYWDDLADHTAFAARLEQELPAAAGRDLWDVGCGDGGLLARLSAAWRKHGVEPGRAAVAAAQQRGLDVKAGTACTLGLERVADVVVSVDVVEHLADPGAELAAMARMLRPGGTLAVFTGDADAIAPRLAGTAWHYLRCVGHVTVLSGSAMEQILRRAGLVPLRHRRIPHPASIPLHQWCRTLVGNRVRALLGRRPAPLYFFHDHRLYLALKPGG